MWYSGVKYSNSAQKSQETGFLDKTGMSNYFPSGAQFKVAGAPGSEAEGLTGGHPLPQLGVRGSSPGFF